MRTVTPQQNNTILFIKAINQNCKDICKYLGQPENLFKEKYNRLVADVEKNIKPGNLPYMAPEEFYRRVYNESVIRLKQVKPI
jgi:hypothetical protein